MSPSTITLLFLAFAVVMFVLEKIPLGVTSMIVCCGLVVTGVLDVKIAFAGFILVAFLNAGFRGLKRLILFAVYRHSNPKVTQEPSSAA